eukprot:CAMPEP_0177637942 /NCGR_PEP_ID=MMETSP0447-20121125/5232_1 /TAXON_ID=0 /ORGANISM="Stygamoeba regulata, Strain BSH-02190019" /LENGTH=317 /DNA_ID=CAMNT_0019139887 /DNA_START=77 /DNA_END=1027 /DNA_ORIENTATION=-
MKSDEKAARGRTRLASTGRGIDLLLSVSIALLFSAAVLPSGLEYSRHFFSATQDANTNTDAAAAAGFSLNDLLDRYLPFAAHHFFLLCAFALALPLALHSALRPLPTPLRSMLSVGAHTCQDGSDCSASVAGTSPASAAPARSAAPALTRRLVRLAVQMHTFCGLGMALAGALGLMAAYRAKNLAGKPHLVSTHAQVGCALALCALAHTLLGLVFAYAQPPLLALLRCLQQRSSDNEENGGNGIVIGICCCIGSTSPARLRRALRTAHRWLALLLSLLAAATLYTGFYTHTAQRIYGALATPLAFALPALIVLTLIR